MTSKLVLKLRARPMLVLPGHRSSASQSVVQGSNLQGQLSRVDLARTANEPFLTDQLGLFADLVRN